MHQPLMNLMIVEDNPDDYEATVRSFKENHFVNPVVWCKNGQEALDYLRGGGKYAEHKGPRPGIVLLDLNMPGLDGRKVLESIKRDAALRTIPVVVLTTSADQDDVDHCYTLGASTYIQKPVGFDELTQAVRTMQEYWFGIALLPQSGEDTHEV